MGVLCSLLDQRVLDRDIVVLLDLFGQLADNVLPVGLERVKLADVRGEIVIQLRLLGHLYTVNLHMEHGILSLELFRVILVGEADVQVLLLTQLHPDHLLFKAGDELVASDGQRLACGGAAGERNAVHGTGIVQVHGVAFLHGTVFHVDRAAGFVAVFLNAGIDHLVRQFLEIGFHGQALVIAKGDVRADKHFQMELQVLPRTDLIQVDLGLVHGLQVIFLDGRTVSIRKQNLKSIIIEDALAVKRFDHLAGSLAPAEAGNVDPLAQLQESLMQRFGELLRGDGERKLGFVSGNLLVGVAHEYRSS